MERSCSGLVRPMGDFCAMQSLVPANNLAFIRPFGDRPTRALRSTQRLSFITVASTALRIDRASEQTRGTRNFISGLTYPSSIRAIGMSEVAGSMTMGLRLRSGVRVSMLAFPRYRRPPVRDHLDHRLRPAARRHDRLTARLRVVAPLEGGCCHQSCSTALRRPASPLLHQA
jgi:hypothetical protein